MFPFVRLFTHHLISSLNLLAVMIMEKNHLFSNLPFSPCLSVCLSHCVYMCVYVRVRMFTNTVPIVCVDMCSVYVSVCMCGVHTCLWRLEADVSCPLGLLSRLLLETGSLPELRAHRLARLPGQPLQGFIHLSPCPLH